MGFLKHDFSDWPLRMARRSQFPNEQSGALAEPLAHDRRLAGETIWTSQPSVAMT